MRPPIDFVVVLGINIANSVCDNHFDTSYFLAYSASYSITMATAAVTSNISARHLQRTTFKLATKFSVISESLSGKMNLLLHMLGTFGNRRRLSSDKRSASTMCSLFSKSGIGQVRKAGGRKRAGENVRQRSVSGEMGWPCATCGRLLCGRSADCCPIMIVIAPFRASRFPQLAMCVEQLCCFELTANHDLCSFYTYNTVNPFIESVLAISTPF